jgi:hypothetical protein
VGDSGLSQPLPWVFVRTHAQFRANLGLIFTNPPSSKKSP